MTKMRWTDKEIDYFRKSAKQTEDTNEWAWWAILGTVVIMEVIFIINFTGAF